MFLEADPQTQAKFIKRVFDAEVEGEMEATLQGAKDEQLKKIKARLGERPRWQKERGTLIAIGL